MPLSEAFEPSDHSRPFVPGAIHKDEFRNFWVNTLRCSPWVENVLKFGYSIPFVSLPEHYDERNNASVRNNLEIAVSLVMDLDRHGVIAFVDQKPTCVNPLGLVSRQVDGAVTHRLVLDVSRWVNLFTSPASVRLAHLEKALEITKKGDYQTIFDLRSAYHHVMIAPEHVQYLGASVDIRGERKFFVFKHLPFGLNSAVHAITKLWKPLTSYIHKLGIRFSIYIDDGRILAKSAQEAEIARKIVYQAVQDAGWQIAWNKSDGPEASGTVKRYLGFLINSAQMTVTYPEDRWIVLKDDLEKALRLPTIGVKTLSSLVGRIAALLPSHGKAVRICTRSCYILLDKHVALNGWSGSLKWSQSAVSEITFFITQGPEFNGSTMLHHLLDVAISATDTFVSDASSFKAAVKWLEGAQQGSVVTFLFDESETCMSSGERELLAMHKLLRVANFQHQFRNAHILWLTDSTNLVSFVNKGSPVPSIQRKIFDIFVNLTKLGCQLTPIHVTREDERIRQVDHLSKVLDTDNWSVDGHTFTKFHEQFGFDIDLFADFCNKKVEKFASKFFHDAAEAVDAFSIPWKGMLWVCPPTSLIPKVVKRIGNSKCKGLLIVPNWPASNFYCLFFDNGQVQHPFQLVQEFRPYIVQNEGARNTPLFGKTEFTFFAFYFNTC